MARTTGMSARRDRLILAAAVAALTLGFLSFPASAGAYTDPETQVLGGKWFSGSAIQQPGENCSVLGSPYTEIMVNGFGSYGGAPGGGVVHVGDQYWADLLVGVPGNPCGSGSTSVATDLKMPAHTAYDSSRPIRCFGTNRFSSDFFEVSNALGNNTWNFLGHSGHYCPTGTNAPLSGIGQGFGSRPLANGQQFYIFVPVKTTAALNGAGETGETGEFNWLTSASAAYANPYRSYTYANVFAGSGGSSPFVYFTRSPSAIPFWDSTASAGTENRVEFFVNLYTAGTGGGSSYLHYTITKRSDNSTVAQDTDDASYNGSVPASPDLVQVLATGPNQGPNGGYVPFAYQQSLWNTPMRITWDYYYNNGTSHATGSQDFTTLAGLDSDGDGVPDASDACPNKPGTLSNGCLPKPVLKGGTTLRNGAQLKIGRLRAGTAKVGLKCNLSSNATGVLKVSRSVADRQGLSRRKIASGAKVPCKPATGGTMKLKLTTEAANKLHAPVGATLTLTFTKGTQVSTVVRSVKVVN